MPFLKLQTSTPVPEDMREPLLAGLSQIISESIGQPEKYVMVTVETDPVMMNSKVGQAAFVDLRSIGGLNREVNNQITGELCALLGEKLEIPQDRVYINFTDIARSNWDWNGKTFG